MRSNTGMGSAGTWFLATTVFAGSACLGLALQLGQIGISPFGPVILTGTLGTLFVGLLLIGTSCE